MIFYSHFLLKTKYLVLSFLTIFVLCIVPNISAQDLTDPLPDQSYFGNQQKAQKLYDQRKQKRKKDAKVEIPTLPLIYFVKELDLRINKTLGNLYYPFVYLTLIFTALSQYVLARIMRHKAPEMAFGYILWLGVLIFNQTMNADMQGLPIIVGFCLIAPIWQLFQLAQFSFIKTLASNIALFVVLYSFTIAESVLAQNILRVVWTIYIIIIYTRVTTYLTHINQVSSWHALTALMPLFGPPTLFFLCIRSRQMMESISTSFVNIILKLLGEEKSRLEIRNYALASRVRLSFFEHNFNIAFRLFEEGKTKVSALFYKLSRQSVLASLGAFIVLSIASALMTSHIFWSYFQEWQQTRIQKTFIELVAKDNDLFIEQLIIDGKISLEPSCTETWKECDPLFMAVSKNSHNVLKLLLQNGVSLKNKNPDGKTIIEIAEEVGSKEILRILKTEQFQRRNKS